MRLVAVILEEQGGQMRGRSGATRLAVAKAFIYLHFTSESETDFEKSALK
jgi:ribosomal protein S9